MKGDSWVDRHGSVQVGESVKVGSPLLQMPEYGGGPLLLYAGSVGKVVESDSPTAVPLNHSL